MLTERSAEVLNQLRDAARNGRRCPFNDVLGLQSGTMLSRMARKGLLIVEVYSRNWRVVEIDGMRTQECPYPGKPYLVIDRAGRHENGRLVPHTKAKADKEEARSLYPNLYPGDTRDRLLAALRA